MMLSSILDIGSFFIGMIINLLLVTLMCYYFKKKYESLEEAQNEQAKLLYELLRDRNTKQSVPVVSSPEVVDLSEGESDDDSDLEELEEHEVEQVKVLTLEPEAETKGPLVIEKTEDMETEIEMTMDLGTEIVIEENQDGFSKMSMKQLRDLLTEKGVKVKPSMKKNELVELAKL